MANLLIEASDQYGLDEEMRAAGVLPYGCNDAREAFRAGYNHGVKTGADAALHRVEDVLKSSRLKGEAQLRSALQLAASSDMPAAEVVDFVAKHAAFSQQSTVPTIEQRMQGQGVDLTLGPPLLAYPDQQASASANLFSPEGAADVYARRRASAGCD